MLDQFKLVFSRVVMIAVKCYQKKLKPGLNSPSSWDVTAIMTTLLKYSLNQSNISQLSWSVFMILQIVIVVFPVGQGGGL